jgi:hypothetical protein
VSLEFDTEADLMSDERTAELPEPRVSTSLPVSVSVSVSNDGRNGTDTTHNDAASDGTRNDAARRETGDTRKQTASGDSARSKGRASPDNDVSMTKLRLQEHLPALDDDADVGVQKEHIVTRDGKADLRFSGVLLASAAPASAPEGHWDEYRIYQTSGGKHVFSKVARSVLEKNEDTHEAEVFDPSPSSVPSQLMRSARELARARPLTWMDAAVAFFGYDPLAKTLYRKLSVRFEEEIS